MRSHWRAGRRDLSESVPPQQDGRVNLAPPPARRWDTRGTKPGIVVAVVDGDGVWSSVPSATL